MDDSFHLQNDNSYRVRCTLGAQVAPPQKCYVLNVGEVTSCLPHPRTQRQSHLHLFSATDFPDHLRREPILLHRRAARPAPRWPASPCTSAPPACARPPSVF